MITKARLLGLPIRSSERSLYRVFLLLATAAAAMAALLALLPPAGHDQLWFLLMACRWLRGAQIYGPRAFDSNPPGIVWLSAIPVLLSRWLGLPVTLLAKFLVVLAGTTASLLSLMFLRRARGLKLSTGLLHSGKLARSYELPALLFAALVLFYAVPARDFGQRDQLLSFLVLPYILAASISPRQHRLTSARCAAGILAALGICLKPHHALIPVAVELVLLFAPSKGQTPGDRFHRLLRPEPIVITLAGLAYLAAIHRFTPLYFTLALPVLRDTYWAIGHLSIAALAFQAIELCVLAAAVIALFLISSRRSPVIGLLIVAGLAATLVYFVQGTGWYYQQLPAIGFFGAALALDLLDRLEGVEISSPLRLRLGPIGVVPATAALCILALGLTTYFTGSPFTRDRAYAPVFADSSVPDPTFFTALAPGTSVAILTTSVEAAMMPVERFHLTWGQRTDNLWLLPSIIRSETSAPQSHHLPPSHVAWLDALQHRWMVEDLTRWHPALILVARCQSRGVRCQELEEIHGSGGSHDRALQVQSIEQHPDDLLAWFLRDPAFAALWGHYAWSGSRGAFDAYTLRPAGHRQATD